MSYIGSFTRRHVCKEPEKVGTILHHQELEPSGLRATRPFLRSREGRNPPGVRRRRRGEAEVVITQLGQYLLDGHHKARGALERGERIMSRVLRTSDPVLTSRLQKMDQGPISDLPVREPDRR